MQRPAASFSLTFCDLVPGSNRMSLSQQSALRHIKGKSEDLAVNSGKPPYQSTTQDAERSVQNVSEKMDIFEV